MDTKIFSILILLMFVVSCVKQDHNNPFDSQCPKELWTPTDFKSTLEGTTVKLTWTQSENRISGFKLTKKVDTGTETALTNQSKDANQLTDASLTGGKVHVYTLVAYAGNNQSNVVMAQITPTFLATVTTVAATSITANSAVLGGSITTDGGAAITERGICWATTANPTTAANKLAIGTGSGTFSNTIPGLSPSTTYYFRAYAINSLGTAYGNEVTATMLSALPTLTTTVVSAITPTTATSGGNITYEGISSVTARGVCWSTTQNPTTANSKTTDGTGSGTFTSLLTGLTPGTQYYVRAYATNGTGTGYGNEQVFTSTAPVLTITPSNQDVTNVAGSTSFAITSNVNWNASSDQTWCKITEVSGIGNAVINVDYEINTTNSQRVATITISGNGFTSQKVTITQKTVFSDTWDAASQYTSTTGNPNGAWSYGRKWSTEGADYNLLTVHWGTNGWYQSGTNGHPSIQMGPNLWSDKNDHGLATVRWTCPKAGYYILSAFFQGVDGQSA
jgi:hypothetical protein